MFLIKSGKYLLAGCLFAMLPLTSVYAVNDDDDEDDGDSDDSEETEEGPATTKKSKSKSVSNIDN